MVSQISSVSYDQFYDAKPSPDLESEGEIVVASFDSVGVSLIKSESADIVSRMGAKAKNAKRKKKR